MKGDEKMQVGACGICRNVCGLKAAAKVMKKKICGFDVKCCA